MSLSLVTPSPSSSTPDEQPAAAPRPSGATRWAVVLGHLAGVEIRLHATLLILLAWIGLAPLLRGAPARDGLKEVAFALLVLASVVLHELGHAVMARRFGCRTRDITLWPIGGIARLERIPEVPKQELLVAVAGPAVNLVLFGALLLIGAAAQLPALDLSRWPAAGSLIGRLAVVNLLLAAFNLLPAFPMDGGRVLRALLATHMTRARATRLAARTGQTLAALLGLVGLLGSPVLVLVAAFVWLSAAAEARDAELHEALAGLPVREVMVTRMAVVLEDDPVSGVLDLLQSTFQRDFPVLSRSGRVVGLLAFADLIAARASGRRAATVGQLCDRTVPQVSPGEAATRALDLMLQARSQVALVVDEGRLVGLLLREALELSLLASGRLGRAPAVAPQGTSR